MRRATGKRLRATLAGGSAGPSGWALSDGSGAARKVTLEALLCLERKLRTDGNTGAADDLYRQITALAGVAEAWRHPERDRSGHLEEAATR
jgi:hypothetical protein